MTRDITERIDDRLRVRMEAEQRVKKLRALHARVQAPIRREAEAYLAGVEAAQEAEGRMALSAKEVAELLGVSDDVIYQGVRAGEIPSKKLGGRVLIPVSRLRAWLESED